MSRFFDTNYLFENFGGTFDASSNSSIANLAFDEDRQFSWTSTGEGTDGNAVYLEQTLAATSTIDTIFVKNTNISDLTIQVDVGSGYVSLSTASTFTLTKSDAGDVYYYKLDSSINLDAIKFEGSNTITANEEKTIEQCLAFLELGYITYNNDIIPKRVRKQALTELNSGKVDIVNKGETWEFMLSLKSHYNSDDNTIIDTILQRDSEMWLWLNDDNEDTIVMSQEPWRFQDIYKVAFQKNDSVKFTKNMYFSGIDVDINLIEVA